MLLRLDGDIRFTVDVEVVRRKTNRGSRISRSASVSNREGADTKTNTNRKQAQSPTNNNRDDSENRVSAHNGFFCISTQLADIVPDLFHVLKNKEVCDR